jgi:hypothetical protein
LELLALFRTLDHLLLAPQQIPQKLLRELFELDADFAEALWALDQPRSRIRVKALLRDTLSSLEQLPGRRQRFLETLSPGVRSRLEKHLPSTRISLEDSEAYHPSLWVEAKPLGRRLLSMTVKPPSLLGRDFSS